MFVVHDLKFREEKGEAREIELIRGYSSVGCTSFEGRNVFGSYNVKRLELMQYTGLKDSNGKEIYEGDISLDWRDKPVVVEWNDELGSCGCCGWDEFQGCGFVNVYQGMEVIGNIYENPELLEVNHD